MSEILIPIRVFQKGLPSVCVVSGRPATTLKERKAENPVGLTWFCLLLGLVMFVIIRRLVRRSITTYLPLDPEAAKATENYRRRRAVIRNALLATIATGAFSLALLALHGDSDSLVTPFLVLAFFLALISSPALMVAFFEPPMSLVKTTYLPEQGVICVKNAHPAFIAALEGRANAGVGGYTAYNASSQPCQPAPQAFAPAPAVGHGQLVDPF